MPPMTTEKPKRAPSSYMLFSNEIRAELLEENKKANGGKCKIDEVAKAISERWAKLDEKEKAKYEEKAKQGKEDQAAAMKAYKDSQDPLGALKEKWADLIPKKPMGAYWIFAQDEASRAKAEKALTDAGEEAAHKKVTAKLGELWKQLADAEKAPWNEKAKKAVTEYEEKKRIWEARPEFIEYQKVENEQKEAAKAEKAKEKEAAKEEKAAAKQAMKDEKKKEQEAGKKAESPKKRKASDEESPPSAKKAKVEKPGKAAKAAKAAKPQEPVVDAHVLQKAQKLGLEADLKNLMSRSDVVAKGFSQDKMLAVLEQSGGLVNKAKHALFGA